MKINSKERSFRIRKDSKVAIVVSSYYSELITDSLYNACLETLLKNGMDKNCILRVDVPGSYELIAGALFAAKTHNIDAVICLGCVIKGETDHDAYINHAISQGLMQLQLRYEIPFAFGVVTTNNLDQAIARSSKDEFNKGIESANACLTMLELFQSAS